MTRGILSPAAIEAIAERVYLNQQRRQGVTAPVPWSTLPRAERWPWQDGVRIYLGAALELLELAGEVRGFAAGVGTRAGAKGRSRKRGK